ncbi:outer membrane beta-barrel protein [Pedobacter nutrimenti]|uniref:outer membrane beta-barrel protein n=1 Tax=Pedobacter nutrimenti TaxID=1241337 RepID=UPI00292F7FA7|nr:outer membrane beta-barrel protein [Pedobacter nutrimenti]
MKKLLTLAAFCACAWTANAQTEKGKILLGGSINYLNNKSVAQNQIQETQGVQNSSTKNNSFSVSPNAGLFIKDNLAIGLGIGYTRVKTSTTGNYYISNNQSINFNQETNLNEFFISPYVRYYIALVDKFKFFGQLLVPINSGKVKTTSNANENFILEYNTSSLGLSVQPGFAFFPSKRISIELSSNGLDYSHNKFKNKVTNEKSSSNSFSFSANSLSPKLGVMFHL